VSRLPRLGRVASLVSLAPTARHALPVRQLMLLALLIELQQLCQPHTAAHADGTHLKVAAPLLHWHGTAAREGDRLARRDQRGRSGLLGGTHLHERIEIEQPIDLLACAACQPAASSWPRWREKLTVERCAGEIDVREPAVRKQVADVDGLGPADAGCTEGAQPADQTSRPHVDAPEGAQRVEAENDPRRTHLRQMQVLRAGESAVPACVASPGARTSSFLNAETDMKWQPSEEKPGGEYLRRPTPGRLRLDLPSYGLSTIEEWPSLRALASSGAVCVSSAVQSPSAKSFSAESRPHVMSASSKVCRDVNVGALAQKSFTMRSATSCGVSRSPRRPSLRSGALSASPRLMPANSVSSDGPTSVLEMSRLRRCRPHSFKKQPRPKLSSAVERSLSCRSLRSGMYGGFAASPFSPALRVRACTAGPV